MIILIFRNASAIMKKTKSYFGKKKRGKQL